MQSLIIVILTFVLFFILNTAFKIYYFGFKGIVSTLIGCAAVAFILEKIFEDFLTKVALVINNWLDQFLSVFPTSEFRERTLLAIGIGIAIIYVFGVANSNGTTQNVNNNGAVDPKNTQSENHEENV